MKRRPHKPVLSSEVMNGNTSDRTTLRGFLKKIEDIYGKARRVWVMDRGIPSEAAHSDDVDQSFRSDADQNGAKRRRALSV
jgi:hypothetical protein